MDIRLLSVSHLILAQSCILFPNYKYGTVSMVMNLYYFEVGHPWFLKEGFPKDFLNIITPNSLSQFNCAKVSKAGRMPAGWSNDKQLHHHN